MSSAFISTSLDVSLSVLSFSSSLSCTNLSVSQTSATSSSFCGSRNDPALPLEWDVWLNGSKHRL